ncbi:MAG TPA: ABC transporter substrate-binding protein [Candidatus Binataceae bacterium]|nr:ABC transporter substrate-binding protein [Candidatus Binataceae bacterium]
MKITLGLSLALSGKYAPMGTQAQAALRLFAADANAGGGIRLGAERAELDLVCIDDRSDPARGAEIYRALIADNHADLLLGPYASDLVAATAPIAEAAGRVFINHGGTADSLYEQRYRMIVGVASPASGYLEGFVRLLGTLKFWRKRMAIIAADSPFARAVAGGVERAAGERAARRRGVRVRVKWNGEFDSIRTPDVLFPALRRSRVNALVAAGSYDHDLAVMRAVTGDPRLNIPVLACVAAGVARFRADLGESAEGIVGPSQWETDAAIVPTLGPAPREFARRMLRDAQVAEPDYVAAQAYAAAMLAGAALEAAGSLDQNRIRAAFSELRATTLLGEFAIDPASGRQTAHRPLLVQWHGGRKVIIETEPNDDTGSLEFPAGWRLIAAGIEMLKLNRGADDESNRALEDKGRQIDERKED